MLQSITISNFKCLREVEIDDFSKLNVLIGPNNSGKSSILQAIAFIAQSAGAQPRYQGNLVKLNGFENVVYKMDKNSEMGFSLKFRLSDEEISNLTGIIKESPYRSQDLSEVEYYLRIGRNVQKIMQSLKFHDKTELCRTFSDRGYFIKFAFLDKRYPIHDGVTQILGPANQLGWRASEIEEAPYATELVNKLADAIGDRLSKVRYFSVMRGVSEWRQGLRTHETEAFQPKSEDTLSLLHHIYSNNKPAFSWIVRWAKEFGAEDVMSRIRGTESYLQFKDNKLKVDVDMVDCGFGLNQLIPIIGQCFLSSSDSLVMIEEPEIHLHPGAISVLTDMFIESIADGKQLLITTHSDRLILELWARVKLGIIDEGEVSVYVTDKTDEGTTAHKVRLGVPVEEVMEELKSLYQPKSPLDELAKVVGPSGDPKLSEKDLSEV